MQQASSSTLGGQSAGSIHEDYVMSNLQSAQPPSL